MPGSVFFLSQIALRAIAVHESLATFLHHHCHPLALQSPEPAAQLLVISTIPITNGSYFTVCQGYFALKLKGMPN